MDPFNGKNKTGRREREEVAVGYWRLIKEKKSGFRVSVLVVRSWTQFPTIEEIVMKTSHRNVKE